MRITVLKESMDLNKQLLENMKKLIEHIDLQKALIETQEEMIKLLERQLSGKGSNTAN